MSVSRQLYQLQGVELELESKEQSLAESTNQLGESEALARAQDKLSTAQQHLEELKKKQQSQEWAIDDLGAKIVAAKETLYSGQIKNPKELSNLQYEVDGLEAQRRQLEDEALEVMGQVEEIAASVATMERELKAVEDEWRRRQLRLSKEIERLKGELFELERKRQLVVAEIDPGAVDFYYQLKRQKEWPVARVEQGTCGGCRLALSTAELQRVRGSSLVQCSSCRRILFLD
jgi:predicted  nucleic acid-binding Zn-ribbon protein